MNTEDNNINRYYLTCESFQINPQYLNEPGASLGAGIDMRDPLRPIVAPYRAFTQPEQYVKTEFGLPKSSELIRESAVLKESLDESEESSILSAYFNASYMLSSVKMAYEAAKKEQQSFHTIYALLEHSGESERLPSESRYWSKDKPPASESISDKDEALQQFVLSYGSHYVGAIRYALRIAVQGKLKKDTKTEATEFSTAFKAAFGNFAADASVRNQQSSKLESMDVDLVLEATSGGRDDGGLLVMRGFEDIVKFLEDVKNNKIKFSVSPIELTLNPYWVTLDTKWENTRAAFKPTTFKPPRAQYGVPKGTIIAWHPPADYTRGLEVESLKTIDPPPGWAICDGTRSTPNLTHHFIMGAKAFEEVGKLSWELKKLNVQQGTVARVSGAVRASTQAVTWVSFEEEGSKTDIPPNVKLVFIMKL